MATTTMEKRLAEMSRQIDELEAKARSSSEVAKARIQREVGELRRQQGSARVAAQNGAERFEEKAGELQARLRVAQSAVAADLADSRETFTDAVEDELNKWDAYFERLQGQTALRAASARDQAETAIADLRRRRNVVAERVGDARATSGAAWGEQKKRITAARDDLERRADDLSARFE